MKKGQFRSKLLTIVSLVFALTLTTTAEGTTALEYENNEPVKVLFVGNSFTYTRPPTQEYNVDNITDMNYENFLNHAPGRTQPFSGIAGIFEAMTTQAGLSYDVSHSVRGGATLRGHYLNTNPENWDMRGNIGAETWDVVILQGNSTEGLARANGNLLEFKTYVDKLEKWIHIGDEEQYRESDIYPGGSVKLQMVPANENKSGDTVIYLYQPWARPDMIYPKGSPYESLEDMTGDLSEVYDEAASSNEHIAGVAPVGNAFLRAVQEGVAVRNPYEPSRHGVDLWWEEDQYHSSKYGSYLSALIMFGTITGIDPASFGANERAAADLDIEPIHALRLQRVASEELTASGFELRTIACLRANPKAKASCSN
ncbi:hypothetical protein [Brevibacillus panacihumi]|uniref:hypothetical protein n=1 Tax=Paenibacillaceae TaxID=186822 RepID=UPI003D088AFD